VKIATYSPKRQTFTAFCDDTYTEKIKPTLEMKNINFTTHFSLMLNTLCCIGTSCHSGYEEKDGKDLLNKWIHGW